jgi:Bacterial RNA polymerase, alpha chain C terminal domain
MSTVGASPRLLVASDAKQSAGGVPAKAFTELNGKLQQAGVDLASICGRPYDECLSRFGPDLLGEVIHVLEATDSGWFVRGIWGKPNMSGDVGEALDRSIFSLNLSLRSVHCLSNAGLRTLRQVVACTDYELLHIKNLGRMRLSTGFGPL